MYFSSQNTTVRMTNDFESHSEKEKERERRRRKRRRRKIHFQTLVCTVACNGEGLPLKQQQSIEILLGMLDVAFGISIIVQYLIEALLCFAVLLSISFVPKLKSPDVVSRWFLQKPQPLARLT